jgi:hypothetical protein
MPNTRLGVYNNNANNIIRYNSTLVGRRKGEAYDNIPIALNFRES